MKSFSLNSTFASLLVLIIALFTACEQENLISSETLISNEQPVIIETSNEIASDINVINGILTFENDKDYRSTLIALNRMPSVERILWESEIGFQSMQTAFNNIMTAETELGDGTHSEIYRNALVNEIIFETDEYYDLNLFNPAYAPVLNENGMIKIGENIYQFTENALKIWENGNINQLNILENATVSGSGIIIHPMSRGDINSRGNNDWSEICESGNDAARMMLEGIFFSDYLIPGIDNVIFIDYIINIKTQYRRPGGWMYDDNATVMLQGNSHTQLTYGDGTNEYIKDIVNDYSVGGDGGNFYFIPDAAGIYELDGPFYFTIPAGLRSCNWLGKSLLATGDGATCQISK